MYTFDINNHWYNKRNSFQSCLLSKNAYINSFNQYDNNSNIICRVYEIKFINNIFIATMWYHRINIDSGNYYIIRSTNGIIWDLYGPLHSYITFENDKISKSIIAYEYFKIIIYSNSHNYCLISYDQGITWNLNSTNKKINKAFNFSNNDIITYYTYEDDDVKYKLGISEHSNNVLNYNPTLNYDNNDVIEKIDEVLYNGINVISLKECKSIGNSLNSISGLNEKKYGANYGDNRNWFDGRNPISSGITIRVSKSDDEGSHYSYNWTGYLTPHISGTWEFRTTSDDGSNLWLDDIHIVNNGGAHGTRVRGGSIHLIAGQSYAIQITYEEYGGSGANMNFGWKSPDIDWQTYGWLNMSAAGIIFTTELPKIDDSLPYNFLKGPSDLYFPKKKNKFYNKNDYFSSGIIYENIEDAFFSSQELYTTLSKNSINAIPSMFIDISYDSNFKYRHNENNMNILACIGNEVTYCDNNKLNKYKNQILYEWKDGSLKIIISCLQLVILIHLLQQVILIIYETKNNNYGYENLYRISDSK